MKSCSLTIVCCIKNSVVIDVAQGDSTLIVTPKNKTILVDGGGDENYDIGENVLIPYLLNKKINKIDYLMISHFDTDHVNGTITVIDKMKVECVIISQQKENTINFQRFIEAVRKKNVKILVVSGGDRIQIEQNFYMDILWPIKNNEIKNNLLNNNSIVAKLNYKETSMLFTGDIEAIVEEELVKRYGCKLKSNILKVPHHGSQTSSIQNFIDLVSPEIALIGVGANNNFGHPNNIVIDRLRKQNVKIYRTDLNGEISIDIKNNYIVCNN